MTNSCTSSIEVALFARSPVIGTVKQRLAQEIGDTEALRCYNALLHRALDATSRYSTTIWYEGKAEVWADIAPDHQLVAQPPGDLGHKMFNALKEGAKLGCGGRYPSFNRSIY